MFQAMCCVIGSPSWLERRIAAMRAGLPVCWDAVCRHAGQDDLRAIRAADRGDRRATVAAWNLKA